MAHNGTPLSPSRKDAALPTLSSPGPPQRQSFTDNLRGVPPSPRTHRQPSLSQTALQELMKNPPVMRSDGGAAGGEEDRFKNRDWRGVRVGEIVDEKEVRFVEVDTSVEDATNLLITSGAPNVVLIRQSKHTRTALGAFDYSDLNAYLLLVLGRAHPDDDDVSLFNDVAQKARENRTIPLQYVKDIGRHEPIVTLPHTASLTQAVEVFGSGIHRIIIVKEGTTDVVGILTQLRLVRFFWENKQHLHAVDQLHSRTLHELDIGSHSVISINCDRPLTAALELMHAEGITSLPVVDNHKNVIGNISHVDVKLLTTTTSLRLLEGDCMHFISVILSERGVYDGRDSYPVFHVTPFSTLAHTVAKLVATRSHRMWIVDAPSPAIQPVVPPSVMAPLSGPGKELSTHGPPYTPAAPGVSAPASTLPGAGMSGRLNGVISLTDILNLYARASGLSPADPDETRRRRRRSSSSSVRQSAELSGSSLDLSRSGSTSSRRSALDKR
ncbi:cell separation during budding [Elasticomyces elasticus]|nr:cell separation during budding [Elasticomyces elasticus]